MFKKLIRKFTKFAWGDLIYDVSRVEYKYGRRDNGQILDYHEWNQIRLHLLELNAIKAKDELNTNK